MKPPDDVRSDLLWFESRTTSSVLVESVPNPERNWPPCNIYWGSHGCARPAGHQGDHWCDCCDCEDHPDPDSGCVAGPPYYGPETRFYT